jgi:hypothetical protein
MKSSAGLFDDKRTIPGGTEKEKTVNLRSFKSACLAFATLVSGMGLAGALQAQPIGSAHWKSKTQVTGGRQGDTTTESEMWMKDKKMRIKTTAMGMNMNVVKSGEYLYQWQEGQTSGMKMPADLHRRGGVSTDYVSKIEEVRTKGKKIGTETVAGHQCDIFEYTEVSGDRSVKQTYWLARDLKNFPIKVVSETDGMKMTSINSDIDLGASVPDAMVKPPDNIKFEDMSEMMKGKPSKRQN